MLNKFSLPLVFALFVPAAAPSAMAQAVVTIGQASTLQAVPKRATKPAPVAARVELKAIYGAQQDIRVSTEVNGRLQEHVKAGDVASGPGAACKVVRIDVAKRCITLALAEKAGGICPADACWSGVDAQPKAEGKPAGERATLLSYPPIPAAPVATQRHAAGQGDVQ